MYLYSAFAQFSFNFGNAKKKKKMPVIMSLLLERLFGHGVSCAVASLLTSQATNFMLFS